MSFDKSYTISYQSFIATRLCLYPALFPICYHLFSKSEEVTWPWTNFCGGNLSRMH